MHMHDAKCILLLEHIMRVEQFHRRSSILVNSQSSIMFFKLNTCMPHASLSTLFLSYNFLQVYVRACDS